MSLAAGEPQSRFPWKSLAGGILLATFVAMAFIDEVSGLLGRWIEAIGQLGAWGPALFIVLYLVATVLMAPGSVLTFGAGAVFGIVRGSLYVSAGATLGASAAFLVGRYLARDWVAKKVAGNARFEAIDRAVAREGWKIVGLTRLSPIFPFNLLNYAFGLTKVRFRDYVLASWIGTMPGTVMYVYLGFLAREAVDSPEHRSPGEWTLYGIGFVATVVLTLRVTHLARKALARREDKGN